MGADAQAEKAAASATPKNTTATSNTTTATIMPSYYDQVMDVTESFANKFGRDLNSRNSTTYWNALTKAPSGANNALSNINRNAATAATSLMGNYSSDMLRSARLDSDSQRRAMEQRLSQGGMLGTDSGAGRRALMQATVSPYAAAQAQIANKQADLAANSYNQLMGGFGNMSEQQFIAPQFMTQEGDKQAATQAQRAANKNG